MMFPIGSSKSEQEEEEEEKQDNHGGSVGPRDEKEEEEEGGGEGCHGGSVGARDEEEEEEEGGGEGCHGGSVGARDEEEKEGGGEGGPQRTAQAQWVESQSQMLDEVNDLVDLMTDEKSNLQDRVSSLEGCNEQLQTENDSLRQQLRQEQEERVEESGSLKEALASTRHELREVQRQVETLTLSFEEDKARFTQLTGRYSVLQDERKKKFLALQTQCAENVKLVSQVSNLQEQTKSLQVENSLLKSKLTSLQQKWRHSQDEVLALRGRLTNSHKSQEKLLVKCSALEKSASSPTVVRVSTRPRQEMKLSAECKRKDELLATYVEAVGTAHTERQKLQQEISKLEWMVATEREVAHSKSKQLEALVHERESERREFEAKERESQDRLTARVEQEREFVGVKTDLEQRLWRIESELGDARSEVNTLRGQVERREEEGRREREKLERERTQAQALMKENRDMVHRLNKELETARQHHASEVERMTRQWQQQLRQAQLDNERIKEASVRRCAELAKEVWKLKDSAHS